MIYLATDKDLMKTMVEDENVDVKKSTFLILSPSIDCSLSKPNVMNVYTKFFSMNCLKGASNPRFTPFDGFKDYLLKNYQHLLFLLESIQSALIAPDENIFFLVMSNEIESEGIKTFVEVVSYLFRYKINEYPDAPEVETVECLKRCIYYTDITDIEYARDLVPEKREQFFDGKKKADLKRIAKLLSLYVPGSSRDDLVVTLTEGLDDGCKNLAI